MLVLRLDLGVEVGELHEQESEPVSDERAPRNLAAHKRKNHEQQNRVELVGDGHGAATRCKGGLKYLVTPLGFDMQRIVRYTKYVGQIPKLNTFTVPNM